MGRSAEFDSAANAQMPLALEPIACPGSESALRAEFRRLEISRRMTFEQAMSDIALAICIRNLADCTARRIRRRRLRRPRA